MVGAADPKEGRRELVCTETKNADAQVRILKDKEEGFARQTGWTDNHGKVLYGAGGWSTTGAEWAGPTGMWLQ